SKENFLNVFISQLSSSWVRYFIKYDPDPYISNIQASVLVLNGDKDIQVVSRTNLPAMEASLKKSHARSYEIKELKGLNHLFQHCTLCTVQEYGTLEETFSPDALKIMWEWLNKVL
ncbi:MAG TPA: hypothetical protein VFQ58_06910, partial [Flavisolibacter sp.]|nr:hypothetical protein [Flavisolibacter sp.]